MFCNDRVEPEKIRLLKILLRYLPVSHDRWKKINDDLTNRLKGFKGEQDVDFFLRQLPEKEYYILRGLRLEVDGDIIQIDTLILTKRFFLINEIKYYSSKVIVDTIRDQFIIIKADGTSKRIQNPIKQADRHRIFFERLLHQLGFPAIPIETMVVSSNPYTIIETIPQNLRSMPNFFHADNLIGQIQRLDKRYTKEIWNEPDIKALIKRLKKLHTPPTYDLLKEFKINFRDLKKGVPCPECNYIPMERKYGGWVCPRESCGCRSKTAHVQAIHNYLELVKPYITNQECREWLKLDSEDFVRRALINMGLDFIGKTNTRIYFKKSDFRKVAGQSVKVAGRTTKVAGQNPKVAGRTNKVAGQNPKVAGRTLKKHKRE